MTTLAIFADVIFPGDPRAPAQAVVLAAEGAGLLSLARSHRSLAPVAA